MLINKTVSVQYWSVSTLPQTPAVRVVSFREELPQWFVHYHHGNRQRSSWFEMAASPIGRRVLLLMWRIGLSWRRGRSRLRWEGIVIDKTGLLFLNFIIKKNRVRFWFQRSYLCGRECEGWTGENGRMTQALWGRPPGCLGTEAASPSPGRTHPGSPRLELDMSHAEEETEAKGEDDLWSRVPQPHSVIAASPLTHVFSDDGERFQVSFPDVLCQGVGVVLEVAE